MDQDQPRVEDLLEKIRQLEARLEIAEAPARLPKGKDAKGLPRLLLHEADLPPLAQAYRRLFLDLMQGLPLALLVRDREGKILAGNRLALKDLKMGTEDLVRKTFYEVFPIDLASELAYLDDYQPAIGGKWLEKEVEITRRGRKMQIHSGKVTLDFGSEADALLVDFFREITTEKESFLRLTQSQEKEKKQKQERLQFLHLFHEELLAPLNGLLGQASLLAGTRLDGQQKKYLESLRQTGEKLFYDIKDILDYAAFKEQDCQLHIEAFALKPFLEEIFDLLRFKAWERSVRLYLLLGPGLPRAIRSDRARLRQVLLNLLDNALSASNLGEILLSLSLESQQADEVVIKAKVEDQGRGIDPVHLEKIFEAFSKPQDGSDSLSLGIGLSLSKLLVTSLGGGLEVTSQEGKGSAFSFTFKAEKAAYVGSLPPIVRHASKVLLLTPSIWSSVSLESQLQDLSLEPFVAADVEDCLRWLEHEQPAEATLVLVWNEAHQLPGLCRQFRSYKEKGLRLIVLLEPQRERLWQQLERDGCFLVAHPLHQDDLVRSLEGERQANQPATLIPSLEAPKILLLSSSGIEQMILLKKLAQRNLGCQIAPDWKRAQNLLAHEHFDLVLVDLACDPEPGSPLPHRLLEACLSQPKLVGLTGLLSPEEEASLKAQGFWALWSRPVDSAQVEYLLSQIQREQKTTQTPSLSPNQARVYFQQAPAILSEIRLYALACHWESCHNYSHLFQGLSESMGLEAMARTGQRLMELAQANQSDELLELVDQAEQGLSEMLEKHRSP